nr:AbrB/MazE/SpoVT family DNA-binding domain-containing protein [Chloroflexota bacterium]
MDVSARMSSKGQVTIPRPVREALALEEGDELVFRVEGGRAVIARSPDLLALAASV